MRPDQPIREQALAWAMLMREPEFADWEGFTAWLEADARHTDAYDAVQFALDETDAALDSMSEPDLEVAANDNPPGGWLSGRSAWLGGAIAASLVLTFSFMFGFGPQSETLYATAPGETRLIALDDGSTVELGGGSRLAVLGERAARLDGGQALFTIRHDAADPFVLTAGDERLVDAGTVFDVRLAGQTLDLAVAEGAVIVNPDAQALRVDAGERAVRTGERYWVGPINPQAVGEWTRGRISFEAASLVEIAAELTRATGITFTAAPSDVRLAGSIALDQVRADPRALEALLGVRVTPRGNGWVIAPE